MEQIVASGERISINAVAFKCGISHSLIYNRYPDLKERIKELKTTQKASQKEANDQAIINGLLAKNKALKNRIKSEDNRQTEESFKLMLVHVQQVYSMYDQILDERNKLAERLSRA